MIEGRGLIVGPAAVDDGKTPLQRQQERLRKRIEWRKQRKQKQTVKEELQEDGVKTNHNMLLDVMSNMQHDVNLEAEEVEEEVEEEETNFPELCSAIKCDDYKEATSNNKICGRIKNMATAQIEEKILEFRSRCFFKRKRCHLRKKAQQVFNQNLRRYNNLTKRSADLDPPPKKDEPKFNHVGQRLKRADCDSGELITRS